MTMKKQGLVNLICFCDAKYNLIKEVNYHVI